MYYVCSYCSKAFASDVRFLKHNCKEKQRTTETKTLIGQIAYIFYEKWSKQQYGKTVDTTSFITSRYYKSFIVFANFVKNIKGLAEPDLFIRLMIDNKFPPNMWYNPKVYIKYLTYIETTTSTSDKIVKTLSVLESIADKNNCELSNVFNYTPLSVITQLIYSHKISPWVLLHSKQFIKFIMTLNTEEQTILDDLINPKEWKQTFDTNTKSVKVIKKCLRQLNL